MQHLKNDMDELFRNAADSYSLLDAPNDWDKIAAQLTVDSGDFTHPKRFIKNFYFFAIAFFCTIFCLHSFTTADYYLVQQGSGFDLDHTSNEYHSATARPLQQIQTAKVQAAKKYFIDLQSVYNGNELKPSLVNLITNKAEAKPIVPKRSLQLSIEKFSNPDVKTKQTGVPMNSTQKRQSFYFGLEGGAAYNQVKGQGLGKPGITIGLIAGYSFSKKLSMESGISFNKKNYHTNGKYFHMNKAGENMPNGMKVIYVDGSSSIFDIPINIKYTVIARKNSRIYALAGISTYIMSKESNKYLAVLNGAEQTVQGVYNQPTHFLGATIQLGLGVEKSLSAKSTIRVSPYVQIPLKGIGVGDIPVMSAGLKIGLTRTVH